MTRQKKIKTTPIFFHKILHYHAKTFIYNPRQQYNMSRKKQAKPSKILHHICEHDPTHIHEAYPSELKRGRKVYCSRSCASHHSNEKSYPVTCKTCGNTFYTHQRRDFCCIECEEGLSPLPTPSRREDAYQESYALLLLLLFLFLIIIPLSQIIIALV